MKPASIIFLIVAAVLALGGFVTMRIAEGIAAKEGIELIDVTDDESGEYVFTYDYEADSVGKISVNVKDAKINIIGSSPEAYIELVNFADGTYEFSSSNRIITINNNSDFSSISSIATMALNFRGLRSIVNYMNVSGREKTVNIYLSDDYPVKIISCSSEEGDISVDGGSSQTDYNIDITSGVLSMNEVSTTSSINITLGEGEIILDDCKAGSLTADVGTGDISLVTSDITKITADIDNGDFTYGYRYDLAYINLDLSAGVGSVKLDGEDKSGYYVSESLPTDAKYKVTLGNGDIVIDSNKTPDN